MTASVPDWVEPMAATLTQERFTGPEWIFERKFDGIRLLAFKQGPDVRLLSRNRLPQNLPSVAEAIANLPVHDVILDGEVTWDRSGAYHVFDILWLDGRDVTSLPLDERRALLSELPLRSPLRARARARRSEAVGARVQRGLGGRHREAARLAVRAPPLAALAEDEVRGVAGARGRRLHRSAGRTRRPGRAARRLLRRGRLRLRRQGRHRLRHEAAAGAARAARCARDPEVRRSPKPRALPRVRAHWVRPEIVVQVAFIEWTVHGKLRHSRLLGVRTDKSAARGRARETP